MLRAGFSFRGDSRKFNLEWENKDDLLYEQVDRILFTQVTLFLTESQRLSNGDHYKKRTALPVVPESGQLASGSLFGWIP